MFALLGLDTILGTLDGLFDRAGIEVAQAGHGARKFAYNRWLAITQGPVANTPGSGPEFVDDPAAEAALLAAFIDDSVDDDLLDPITPDTIAAAIAWRDPAHVQANMRLAEEARALLHARSPGWGMVFDLVVNRIYCVDLPGSRGGSTAHAIGSIWINLPPSTPRTDMAELLVHELTHQLTFLDHHLQPHYLPGGANALATSAIRRTPRPAACVLDSLLVGVEILALRAYFLGEPDRPRLHPSADTLVDGCFDAAASLRAVAADGGILSARGRYLLERSLDTLSILSMDLGLHRRACSG